MLVLAVLEQFYTKNRIKQHEARPDSATWPPHLISSVSQVFQTVNRVPSQSSSQSIVAIDQRHADVHGKKRE